MFALDKCIEHPPPPPTHTHTHTHSYRMSERSSQTGGPARTALMMLSVTVLSLNRLHCTRDAQNQEYSSVFESI